MFWSVFSAVMAVGLALICLVAIVLVTAMTTCAIMDYWWRG